MKDTSNYPNFIDTVEQLDNDRDLYYLIFEQSLDDYCSKAESLDKLKNLLDKEIADKKAQEVLDSLGQCIGITLEAKRVMLQNKELFTHINENNPSGQTRQGLDVFKDGDKEAEKIADDGLTGAINTYNNVMLSNGISEGCIDEHTYLYGEDYAEDCSDKK